MRSRASVLAVNAPVRTPGQVATRYEALGRLAPSPVVDLNRAVLERKLADLDD